VLLPIYAATLPVQLALDSRPLPRRELAAGLARAGLVQPDLRILPSEPRRFNSGQLAALNAISNPLSLILLAFVDAVIGIAVLSVVLLLIDSPARPIQLALDSRPLLWSELAAGTTRPSLIQPDLRLPSLNPRRFNSGQLAAANALSNPLLLITLTLVDAISSSLRQASRRDYGGYQGRHHKPFHEPLHYQLPPWPAASGGRLKG
jgi:hypothetical protein